MAGAITYTIFFEYARVEDSYVIISTHSGVIVGKVQDIHSDGVFIVTDDDVIFAIGFEDIEYVGERKDS